MRLHLKVTELVHDDSFRRLDREARQPQRIVNDVAPAIAHPEISLGVYNLDIGRFEPDDCRIFCGRRRGLRSIAAVFTSNFTK